jgi:hypothetical protein
MAGAAAQATVSLGGGRRVCLAAHCNRPAQFTCQRDGWPETSYCLADLEERIILYRKNSVEITFTDEARHALVTLERADLLHE